MIKKSKREFAAPRVYVFEKVMENFLSGNVNTRRPHPPRQGASHDKRKPENKTKILSPKVWQRYFSPLFHVFLKGVNVFK